MWAKARRDWLTSLKAGRPCSDCGGVFHPVAMSWHHLDPSAKLFSIGASPTHGKDSLLAEIAKCILLCANCHMVREYT